MRASGLPKSFVWVTRKPPVLVDRWSRVSTTSERRLVWSVSSWVISSRLTAVPPPEFRAFWALIAAVFESAMPELPSWVEICRPRTSMP